MGGPLVGVISKDSLPLRVAWRRRSFGGISGFNACRDVRYGSGADCRFGMESGTLLHASEWTASIQWLHSLRGQRWTYAVR